MEHIPLHEAVRWLENSKRSVNLLKSFFIDRMRLEENIETMWKMFASQWQKKFMNLEQDPLFKSRNGKKSLAEILRLMAKEPEDNAIVACFVKSSLQRKQNSPSALLQKWLSSAADKDSIEEYKITYMSAVENMAELEKNVIKAGRILNEKRNEKLETSYRMALDTYKKEKTSFCQTMMELQGYLEGSAKRQMNVVQESLQKYMIVISGYDEQRMSRKQRMSLAKRDLSQFLAGKTVEDWIHGLQEPIMFPDYESKLPTPPPPPKVCQAAKCVSKKPVIPKTLWIILEEPEEEAPVALTKKDTAEKEAAKQKVATEKETSGEETDEETATEEETSEEEVSAEEAVSSEKKAKKETAAEEFAAEKEASTNAAAEEETAGDVQEILQSLQNTTKNSHYSAQVDMATADNSKARSVYAIQSYQSQEPGHLSFRFGQKIKQLSLTDTQGLAYGYTVKGKWPWLKKQKKFGFYPIHMVATERPKKFVISCFGCTKR